MDIRSLNEVGAEARAAESREPMIGFDTKGSKTMLLLMTKTKALALRLKELAMSIGVNRSETTAFEYQTRV